MFCGCEVTFGEPPNTHVCPRLPGPPRRAAGDQREGHRVRHAHRAGAQLPHRRADHLPPQELLLSRPAQGLPDLAVRPAAGHRRSPGRGARGRERSTGWASPASTWRRTRASWCTRAAPPAASPAPTTPWWTSTGAARPWWRSSASRTSPRPSRPGPSSRSCGAWWSSSASPTSTWRKARCAATPTSRSASPGEPFGTKTELKNMNSFRFLHRGLEAEIERQIDSLEAGERIVQETVHFDPATGQGLHSAEQGRGPRLPLLPRAGPSAHRTVRRVRGAGAGLAARASGRPQGTTGRSVWFARQGRGPARGQQAPGRLFRDRRRSSRRLASVGELGAGRPLRPSQYVRSGRGGLSV